MNRNNLGQQGVYRQGGQQLVTYDPGRDDGRGSGAPLFDFRSVFRLLRRRRVFVAAVCVLCVSATVVVHRLTPQVYSAATRVLLDEQVINPFGREEIFSDLSLSNPAVESQMQVIRSPYLLSRVVDRLGLSDNEEFMAPRTTPLRERLSDVGAYLFPSLNEEPEELSAAVRFQVAVERLSDNLRVTRNAQNRVIRIQYTSSSPEFAAEVVNAVAETYIDNRLGLRQETAERAALWFDERMAELNTRALEVEQRMEQMSGGGLEALDASQSGASLQRARQELQNALATRARAQTDVLRLRSLVESGRGLRGVPSTMESDALATLADEAQRLRAELSDVLQANPQATDEVARLTARLESVEEAGQSVLSSLLQDAEAAEAEAEAELAAAQAAFDASRASNGGSVTNAIDVELRTLEGEARIYRELNERYLQSYLEVVQQQSFPSTEATIIETALVPENPDGPGLSRLGVLALLFGVAIGAGGAFAVEAADGRVRTTSQLTRVTRAPVLGVLPAKSERADDAARSGERKRLPSITTPNRRFDFSHEVIALPENRVSLVRAAPQINATVSDPLSRYSESIRRVHVEAENLHTLLDDETGLLPKCVGFISDRYSEGRSIAAVNYAEMLAVGGGRTLLIDMDWTGLYLTESISPAAQYGLADLSMNTNPAAYEQALWYDERSSMYFLPNRSMNQEAVLDPGAFDQSRLKALIRVLAQRFDHVVLDLSPMADSSDAAAFSDTVLGYVAVADWGATKAASLSRELRRAAIQPPKLMGTLLNGVTQRELDEYETAV